MPKDKKSVVKGGGIFGGTAKHRRTAVIDVAVKKRVRAPCVPRTKKAAPGARKVKYEPSIDSDKSEEDDEDNEIPECCIGCRRGRICKVEEKKVKATLGLPPGAQIVSDVSIKCCQCEERKCPDCELSVQCPTNDEHGFCPDCEDNAELCEDCGSCIECRPGGDYCCKSYMFKNDRSYASDDSW